MFQRSRAIQICCWRAIHAGLLKHAFAIYPRYTIYPAVVRFHRTTQTNTVLLNDVTERTHQGLGKSKVEYAPKIESGPIFNFYMGKNTPERKDYIMERLVVPVEE